MMKAVYNTRAVMNIRQHWVHCAVFVVVCEPAYKMSLRSSHHFIKMPMKKLPLVLGIREFLDPCFSGLPTSRLRRNHTCPKPYYCLLSLFFFFLLRINLYCTGFPSHPVELASHAPHESQSRIRWTRCILRNLPTQPGAHPVIPSAKKAQAQRSI